MISPTFVTYVKLCQVSLMWSVYTKELNSQLQKLHVEFIGMESKKKKKKKKKKKRSGVNDA